MSRKTHFVLQAVLIVVGYGSVIENLVPPKYKAFVIIATGITQKLVALYAQGFNPDGTNAAVAYLPPPKN